MNHKDTLEQIIDGTSLQEVIEMLSEIASEKAEHLQTNWQDKVAAKSWRHDAVVIGRIEHRIQN